MQDVMRVNPTELSDEQRFNIKTLKQEGNQLYKSFEDIRRVSNGTGDEYFKLAKQRLEEAVMWAVKGASS